MWTPLLLEWELTIKKMSTTEKNLADHKVDKGFSISPKMIPW